MILKDKILIKPKRMLNNKIMSIKPLIIVTILVIFGPILCANDYNSDPDYDFLVWQQSQFGNGIYPISPAVSSSSSSSSISSSSSSSSSGSSPPGWTEITGSALQNYYSSAPAGLMSAWSGAGYVHPYIAIFGCGHTNCFDNGLYAFDITILSILLFVVIGFCAHGFLTRRGMK